MRIGIAGISHETNTFALERNDRMECVYATRGEEVLSRAHPKGFIGGFAEAARQPGVELVPAVNIGFAHGGIIGARVFESCCAMIVEGLKAAGPLDGVYFAFHGAMVAEEPYTDAEGEVARAVRQALGPLPSVATYDFHAITSAWEAEQVVAFPNNTNPHIDGYERGLEAGACLIRMIRGQVHPVTQRIFVPIIGPNIGQSTWSHIPEQEERLLLYQLNRRREELEQLPGVINLTILGGYGYADAPDAGMSVIATTDDDPALAERLARELAQELWQRRQELMTVRPILSIDEGIRQAMSRSERPVLLVDLGDDPGSACPADSPAVLARLLALGAQDCALTIRDAPAVAAAMQAGVGAEVTIPVGGSIDQRFYQPVTVTGRVRSLDDGEYAILGPTHGGWGRQVEGEARRYARVGPRAVLRVGERIDVILSRGSTGKDRDFFKSAGVILEEKQILVVKSNQAHRASFDPVVASTIELNTPGVSTVDYASLPYRLLRRPIWPIDPEMTWEG
ncbi:MAG: M81 family metallopeptidase [Candidatus Latescibacterota bacterium]|jgi:microcystin degradation protein MlrC